MIISQLPLEVARALRDLPNQERAGGAPSLQVQRRITPRGSAGEFEGPRGPARRDEARRQPFSPGPSGLPFQSPAHVPPAGRLPVSGTSQPSFFSTAVLIALVPPVGILAVWALRSYPREGKIAASVGGVVWMLVLGLAFATLG